FSVLPKGTTGSPCVWPVRPTEGFVKGVSIDAQLRKNNPGSPTVSRRDRYTPETPSRLPPRWHARPVPHLRDRRTTAFDPLDNSCASPAGQNGSLSGRIEQRFDLLWLDRAIGGDAIDGMGSGIGNN